MDLTFKFSLAILDFCENLERDRKYVLPRQLLKSGTSVVANVLEAHNAESKEPLRKKQTKLNIGSCSVKNKNTTQIPNKFWKNYKASFVSFLKSLAHLNHNSQILKSSNFQINYVR
jgi:hypothetical protein